MKVRILKDWPLRVSAAVSLQFTKGSEVTVLRHQGLRLIAQGAAEEIPTPKPKHKEV